MARTDVAVPSGRRVGESSPQVVKVYISFVAMSLDSSAPRLNRAVSSKASVSTYP
jgi:hypothetical protein